MKKLYKGFIMALSMFTILPTPYVEWDDDGVKNMMKFYPLIGLIIGILWSIIYYLASILNISIVLKSSIITIVPFIITGMLHLDGFMDVCDAILSRRSKEEKLRILKDSATGAFAVISLVILFFLQFGGVYSILEKNSSLYTLILIPIISRSVVAYYLLSRATIKESTLGTYFKKGTNVYDKLIMIITLIIALIISVILLNIYGIILVLLMSLGIKLSVEKCRKEFGGISGDVAGFALVIGEVVGILILGIIP
ncbi:adenosylcobinamide-GDP ribazoletransferase [Clostridium sp. 2-1]|uniref:adenosylcobinamide-GDP ribazoletransferase n=1 Tax=Clostridium TaxID=1485 RepID=UPI000CDB33D2|nr:MULTISPECIES: adenosylcobinamide-GDP ribazoletransferase [Clostridium]MBN7572545.1 adenosylcobinamide-GDP ribazoletransferase [Clostridium beijerinckii]MBN7577488.1 adenosylcobinamide-GDP ribazoletransferase [Clostridium beijerinckii]MBN7582318.1 adenosylcobinamide-GDP ribazoletransferase [Clostridium beijerinckii]MBO0518664.1 adenosylcobinamide-GDP ribazoletransferase [Clostridium beijerinckii]POO93056.1 adenosylcobinamide-GDP ribazoletransferase [Clostridium sp. 2-1]